MAPKRPDSFVPQCPRCGYDQSGLIATWEASCPLEGVCSECGYAFRWREVLNPEERRLDGFVEHCRWKLVPLVAFRTLAWALLPWVLWRRVKLHHEVVPKRLLAWVLVVLVGWHVANAGLAVLDDWVWKNQRARYYRMNVTRATYVAEAPDVHDFVVGLAWPFFQYEGQWSRVRGNYQFEETMTRWGASWTGLVAASLVYPVLFVLLRGSRLLNSIRTRHVLRAAVFALAWVGLPLLWRTVHLAHSTIVALTSQSMNARGEVASVWRSMNGFFVWSSYVLLAWLGIYWFLVMKLGWSFRQTFFHWLFISIIVGLVGTLFGLLVNPFSFI